MYSCYNQKALVILLLNHLFLSLSFPTLCRDPGHTATQHNGVQFGSETYEGRPLLRLGPAPAHRESGHPAQDWSERGWDVNPSLHVHRGKVRALYIVRFTIIITLCWDTIVYLTLRKLHRIARYFCDPKISQIVSVLSFADNILANWLVTAVTETTVASWRNFCG